MIKSTQKERKKIAKHRLIHKLEMERWRFPVPPRPSTKFPSKVKWERPFFPSSATSCSETLSTLTRPHNAHHMSVCQLIFLPFCLSLVQHSSPKRKGRLFFSYFRFFCLANMCFPEYCRFFVICHV